QTNKDIEILQIKKNIIVVRHLKPDDFEPGVSRGCSVFYLNKGKWNYLECGNRVVLSYINNDKNPDVILFIEIDISIEIFVYLSDDSGDCKLIQKLVPDGYGDISVGIKDEDTQGMIKLIKGDSEINGKITTFSFDSSKNQFIEK
ncbi:MAG: hypothetical protein JW982_04285, partial [Spirochaetes bacterium]|nr:hypothetical protein [Spirochaetota bacterium]